MINLSLKFSLVAFVLYLLVFHGRSLMTLITNETLLEEVLVKLGPAAWIGFLVLNIVQVILAPIPGVAVGVAGGFLFGFWGGFILNLIGILIGSIIAFLFARWLGRPLVDKFVSGKTASFLEKVATSKGIKGIALIYLLPFLPDDALSFMVGLTKINFRTFFLIVALCRTPGTFVASMTGAGLINLPLYFWIIVGIVTVLLLIIYWIKSEQIDLWIKGLVLRD
ncbi:MAG: VTT domain-containing protein [Firmicutes bacterium]|nr:VTT domain-containing protein [Bacillota bacterium]